VAGLEAAFCAYYRGPTFCVQNSLVLHGVSARSSANCCLAHVWALSYHCAARKVFPNQLPAPRVERGCEVTDTESTLYSWAESETRISADRIALEIEQLSLADKYWATFLPDKQRELWPSLSLDARIIAFVAAFNLKDGFDSTVVL
jgi:hypothetical protein